MKEGGRHKKFFERLYHNAYNLGRRNGKDALVTAHFSIDGKNKVVANKEKTVVINDLRSMADYFSPDKVMVVLESGDDKKVYKEDFSGSVPNGTDRTMEQGAVPFAQQRPPENTHPTTPQSMNGFQGFGQVSVEEYINKKLEDERRDQQLKGLESELGQRSEEIEKLNAQIEKLETDIEESERQREELEKTLESKKNIRYWAGFTGDILESFGLKKENLREPLAGLMATEPEGGQEALTGNTNDRSGIVEENPPGDKRDELITLIGDYLQGVDNKTLADVFLIFSEIERDNKLAAGIINFLNTKNGQENAEL